MARYMRFQIVPNICITKKKVVGSGPCNFSRCIHLLWFGSSLKIWKKTYHLLPGKDLTINWSSPSGTNIHLPVTKSLLNMIKMIIRIKKKEWGYDRHNILIHWYNYVERILLDDLCDVTLSKPRWGHPISCYENYAQDFVPQL